jgi:ATP-dependent exoDNAse (exonuclease V) alpha subunit
VQSGFLTHIIKEHDRVVLKKELPEQGLKTGDVGTVTHVHRKGEQFEVEFVALDGETLAIVTLDASQVRPVQKREITHARLLQA